MKKITTIVFYILVTLSFLAVIIEVINPHSYLLTTGAFIRVALLLIGLFGWIVLSKKSENQHLISGTILITLTACLYFFYGVKSFCNNSYYEETTHAKIEKGYSCPGIIKDYFFKNTN